MRTLVLPACRPITSTVVLSSTSDWTRATTSFSLKTERMGRRGFMPSRAVPLMATTRALPGRAGVGVVGAGAGAGSGWA